MGHFVSPDNLAIAMDNNSPIQKADFLPTLTQLRRFLGVCNVYRRYIKGFSKIARPLNNMLRKDSDLHEFEDPKQEQLEPFELLKMRWFHRQFWN